MMNYDIDRIIKDYYQNQHLSADKEAGLLKLINNQGNITGYDRWNYVTFVNNLILRIRTAWAAYAVCLGVIVLLVSFLSMYYQITGNGLKDRIIKEVRLNHERNLELTIKSSSIHEFQQQMIKLNFTLAPLPNRIKHYFILGARYCSINGEIAALIRLQDNYNKSYTLYQTVYKKKYYSFSRTKQHREKFFIEFSVTDDVLLIIAHGND